MNHKPSLVRCLSWGGMWLACLGAAGAAVAASLEYAGTGMAVYSVRVTRISFQPPDWHYVTNIASDVCYDTPGIALAVTEDPIIGHDVSASGGTYAATVTPNNNPAYTASLIPLAADIACDSPAAALAVTGSLATPFWFESAYVDGTGFTLGPSWYAYDDGSASCATLRLSRTESGSLPRTNYAGGGWADGSYIYYRSYSFNGIPRVNEPYLELVTPPYLEYGTVSSNFTVRTRAHDGSLITERHQVQLSVQPGIMTYTNDDQGFFIMDSGEGSMRFNLFTEAYVSNWYHTVFGAVTVTVRDLTARITTQRVVAIGKRMTVSAYPRANENDEKVALIPYSWPYDYYPARVRAVVNGAGHLVHYTVRTLEGAVLEEHNIAADEQGQADAWVDPVRAQNPDTYLVDVEDMDTGEQDQVMIRIGMTLEIRQLYTPLMSSDPDLYALVPSIVCTNAPELNLQRYAREATNIWTTVHPFGRISELGSYLHAAWINKPRSAVATLLGYPYPADNTVSNYSGWCTFDRKGDDNILRARDTPQAASGQNVLPALILRAPGHYWFAVSGQLAPNNAPPVSDVYGGVNAPFDTQSAPSSWYVDLACALNPQSVAQYILIELMKKVTFLEPIFVVQGVICDLFSGNYLNIIAFVAGKSGSAYLESLTGKVNAGQLTPDEANKLYYALKAEVGLEYADHIWKMSKLPWVASNSARRAVSGPQAVGDTPPPDSAEYLGYTMTFLANFSSGGQYTNSRMVSIVNGQGATARDAWGALVPPFNPTNLTPYSHTVSAGEFVTLFNLYADQLYTLDFSATQQVSVCVFKNDQHSYLLYACQTNRPAAYRLGVGPGVVSNLMVDPGAQGHFTGSVAPDTRLVTNYFRGGALRVSLDPPESAAAGARWSGDGRFWETSGVVVIVQPGNYHLYFNAPMGWIAPPERALDIHDGGTNMVLGMYTQVVNIVGLPWADLLLAPDEHVIQCDFSNGRADHWIDDGSGRWSVVDETYRMGGNNGVPTRHAFSLYDRRFTNCAFSASVVQNVGTNLDGYGLYMHADGVRSNMFQFLICSRGQYTFGKYVKGIYTSLQAWSTASQITPGMNVWNKLKIVCRGAEYELYINDQLVKSGTDTSLSAGQCGFFGVDYDDVHPPNTFSYDNVRIEWE